MPLPSTPGSVVTPFAPFFFLFWLRKEGERVLPGAPPSSSSSPARYRYDCCCRCCLEAPQSSRLRRSLLPLCGVENRRGEVVKVLSMSRLGAASAFQHLAVLPLPVLKGEANEDRSKQQVRGWWSTCDRTEQQVVKLMEEDIGAAMQFLQSNAIYMVPIVLAASICQRQNQSGASSNC